MQEPKRATRTARQLEEQPMELDYLDMEEDSSSGLLQDFSVEFLRRLPSSEEDEVEEEVKECQFSNMRVLA